MSTTLDKSEVNAIRIALGIGGVLALITGIVILVWPGRVVMVATAIIAIYAIAVGLAYAGLGIFAKAKGGWSRIGHILLGVMFIISGIVAFSNLGAAAGWLAIFLGVLVGTMWIVEGVVALLTLGQTTSNVWTLVFATLSVIAGILLVISPLMAPVVLLWMLGISAIVLGIAQIIRAFTFGK